MFHANLFLICIQQYNNHQYNIKNTKPIDNIIKVENNKNNKNNNKCIYCGNDEWSDLCTCS